MMWIRTPAMLVVLGCLSCGRHPVPPQAPPDKAMPPVVATAFVDKALASTEDDIKFTVSMDREASVEASIPDIGGRIVGFRIADFGTEEKREGGGAVTVKWFLLRADVVGSYVLPEVEVRYSYQGSSGVAKTSEIFVEIQALNTDRSEPVDELRDIKDLEFSPSNRVVWLALMAGGVLAGAVGYYVYKKRGRLGSVAPSLPPHEVALQRLEELGFSQEWDALALKRYYFSLSEIVREYVERRYQFGATDMTSEEIIRFLGAHARLPEAERPGFEAFLKESDLVKFTDVSPSSEDALAVGKRIREFVLRTQPASEPSRESVV